MICVLATIEVVEGRMGDFLEVFQGLAPKVQAEQGCLEYAPWVDLPTEIGGQPAARPNTVTIVEKWESVEALERHLMAPHMVEFRKVTGSMRTGSELRLLQPA